MKKFFVPSAWGKDAAPLKFRSGNSMVKADPGGKKVTNPKKKNKNKSKISESTSPDKQQQTVKTSHSKLSGIKSGRVSKAKNKPPKRKLPNVEKTASSLKGSIGNIRANSFESKLKENLMGGRFRFINEQLYTMDSLEAVQLFNEDKDAFVAYHEGYRHQVEKWPFNPLNKIIKMIKKLPKSLVIADFGCGEGILAKSVPNKVFSIDLVSANEDIIACDMSNTPLKSESIDIAVFCLSLMGTNLNDFLLEANRVLKMDGLLYIAEIQTRFDDVQPFIKCLAGCGFKLIKKDTSFKLFYFFQLKKEQNVGKVAILHPLSLKPCLYRKR